MHLAHDRSMNHAPESSAEASRAADRITITLTPKVARDLARLKERTDLSKTDLVNRAITLYEFIDAQIRDGGDILVQCGDETRLVTFL